LGEWRKASTSGNRPRYWHGLTRSVIKRGSRDHYQASESEGLGFNFLAWVADQPFQDEDEDWSRWRDVIFKAKGALAPRDIKIKAAPPQNRRKRGGPAETESEMPSAVTRTEPQLTDEEVASRVKDPGESSESLFPLDENGHQYCPECYLPLHPDPNPESLYIFLHALRYTTSLGSFETEMPDWAAEGVDAGRGLVQ
jgi:hypothetical protein